MRPTFNMQLPPLQQLGPCGFLELIGKLELQECMKYNLRYNGAPINPVVRISIRFMNSGTRRLCSGVPATAPMAH